MADKIENAPVDSPTVLPGAVISPGDASQPMPLPQAQPASPAASLPTPPAPAAEPVPEQPVVAADEAPQPDSQEDDSESITWTASEFVAHDKSAGWYLMLAIAAVLIAGLVFLITRDYISVGVVFAAALILGFFGSHKPRQLQYSLTHQGIDIDTKHYAFENFRTFSVIPEGAFSSIVLMPLKRFAPPLSIYFAPEDEEKITDLLASCLPFEERRRDAVDSLMHRIRF